MLRISKQLIDEIVLQARQSRPNESCGILAGRGNEAQRAYPITNAEPSPVSFILDSKEQIAAMRDIEREGMQMVAIYHSHPESPPIPSPTDIRQWFFPGTREPNYPGVAFVIISLSGTRPEIKAYDIAPDGVKHVEIQIIQSEHPL